MNNAFKLKANEFLHDPNSKKQFNLEHFTESAPRYDLATRLLSFGRDSVWKKSLLGALPIPLAPICVDLACGTGDVAFGLADKFPNGSVIGLDLTEPMIEIAYSKNNLSNLTFDTANMCETGIASNSVDIVTGSYAIRNAPDLDAALNEIVRILRPGGTAAFLDFSKPSAHLAQKLQSGLLNFWGSFCGLLLHGNPEVHGYISSSLKNFPDRDALLQKFADNGLRVVTQRAMCMGMIEITITEKL